MVLLLLLLLLETVGCQVGTPQVGLAWVLPSAVEITFITFITFSYGKCGPAKDGRS